MFVYILFLNVLMQVFAGPATESFKDQFCTDPRTMRKHAAYTEWADAYSCTRHRCQPGGRNLAIYTVGCKRVEAPESAIECEEVVEDTNMQFPYCCTRLRCLVVVRGEVWTRVLGQPWETLPAAPWSHMYKMKKPPPSDGTFLPKNAGEGPVYELTELESDAARDKVLRPAMKTATECNDVAPRAAPAPDIVIALSTNNEIPNLKEHKKSENGRHKRIHKTTPIVSPFIDEENERHDAEEENIISTEKPLEASDEKMYANAFGVTQRVQLKSAPHLKSHEQVSWTEIPQNQWNEHDPSMDTENQVKDSNTLYQADLSPHDVEKKGEKPNNLQALVDAIGTRMRDIENVVQKMSEKVHQAKPGEPEPESSEKKPSSDTEVGPYHKEDIKENAKENFETPKKPNSDGEHYKRFSVRNRGSKYLHSATESATSEQPLFIEDTNMNGYFSDASNSVLRRANPPKEPAPTYMAPVENRRKNPPHVTVASDTSEEAEKKHKKHGRRKKKTKGGRNHKKHHGKDTKKRFSRVNSIEVDRNVVSLEDSSIAVKK